MSCTTKVKRRESSHQLLSVKYIDNNILFNYNSKNLNDLWCGRQPKYLLLFTPKMLYTKGSFSGLTQKKIQIHCWKWHFLTCKWYFPGRQVQCLARGASLFITVVDNMEKIFSTDRMRITAALAGLTLKLGLCSRTQDAKPSRRKGSLRNQDVAPCLTVFSFTQQCGVMSFHQPSVQKSMTTAKVRTTFC